MLEKTDLRALAARLKERLPEGNHDKLDRLADACCPPNDALRLIVLGAFSVGKSTLLNSLIGAAYLHVAKQEATSLPTFIEHGAVPAMALVGNDGSVLAVDAAGFRDAIACAPDGAACATLALPLPWLEGVTLVDLPGLGSVSAARQHYTAAQVQQADAVLYLLDPRGPGRADIEALRMVAQYGKRVKVVVARWDEVLAAQARGEPVPEIDAWSAQIEAQAGLRARLAGVSRDGLGKEELIDFVVRARADRSTIRQRRFRAELRPLLQNASGINREAQLACAADSEHAIAAQHAALIEHKDRLLELKSGLYERQQQDKAALAQAADDAVAARRQALERELDTLADAVDAQQDWTAFESDGGAGLRGALAGLAAALSAQSDRYGVLELPQGEAERLDIRVPPLVNIDAAAFVDVAKLAVLERAILDKQQEIEESGHSLALLPDAAPGDAEFAMFDKMRIRAQVAGQALPLVTVIEPGNGAAEIGRIVGELADVALMFVEPVSAGAKVGALVGQGAKAVKVSVDVAKVGDTIGKGVRAVQLAKNGAKGVVAPPPVLDKLGMLQALSLGYWGERIGMALGGAPRERLVVDKAALAERDQALAMLDHDIMQARRELARRQDLLDEQQATGWAREQGKRDLARLQQEADTLAAQREERLRHTQALALDEHRHALRRVGARAAQDWLASYDRQAAAMVQLLLAHVAAWWDDEVAAVLGERAAGIDRMLAQLHAAPAARDAMLAALEREAQALEACLGELD